MTAEYISDVCVLYAKERESVGHQFFPFYFLRFLWCQVIGWCDVFWCSLVSVSTMIEAWRMSPFSGCGLVLWRLIPLPFFG